MRDFDRRLLTAFSLFTTAFACHKADESSLGGKERSPALSASAVASARAVTEAPERDADSEASALSELPPGDGGTWIASDIYDLKLASAKYCSKPASKGDASEGKVWLGVKLDILAKTDEVFLDRRHATLRDKGVYFQASLDPEPFAGCTPPFKPVQLKRGQTTSGYVVFELPQAWPNLVLEFQPTRWGGAGRVKVKVPDPGKAP
jgi:hypothetical protein